jgi:hypothetical protein
MWSSGRWPARAAQFRRAPKVGSTGDGRGVAQGFPRLDFDLWLGRWWRRRAPSVAPGGGSHGGARSGEVAAPWRR